MLQVIRKKMQGIVAWVLFVLIGISFLFWGVSSGPMQRSRQQAVAKVDGHKVTWSEVDEAFKYFLHYFTGGNNSDNLTDAQIAQLKQMAKRAVINELAVILGTFNEGFRISDAEIVRAIVTESRFQTDGKFSAQKYKKFLQAIGKPEELYRESMRKTLLSSQPYAGLMKSSFLLDNELSRISNLVYQTRDFGFAVVPYRRYMEDSNITEEAVREYYDNHASSLLSEPQVKIAYIEMSLQDMATQVDVDNAELERYYTENLATYSSPELVRVRHILKKVASGSDEEKSGEVREQLEALLNKIKLGADFAELASQESDDPGSKARGGDIGWMGLGELVPEFEKEAFALREQGEVSEIVKTAFGYHIIQLIDRKAASVQPFAAVKDKVKEHYGYSTVEAEFLDRIEELDNLSFEYNGGDGLAEIAEQMQLQLKESEFFTEQGGNQGITAQPLVVAKAFSKELLDGESNSGKIMVRDNHYAVIRVIDHLPARELSYDEARAEIVAHLQTQAAQRRAVEIGEVITAGLDQGQMPHGLTKRYNLDWQVRSGVNRQQADEVTRIAFAMSKQQLAENKKFVNRGVALSSGDYLVVSLTKVQGGANADAKLEKDFESSISQIEYSLYRDKLINSADIEMLDNGEQSL